MTDLNTMLREQAAHGLQLSLDAAVEAGDTATARQVSEKIAALAVQTAPKQPAFGNAEILAALDTKAEWFGKDPKKSAKAMEFGKTMDPKKFGSAEAFADAVLKAVEDEFKPAAPAGGTDDDEGDEDGDEGDEAKEAKEKRAAAAARRTDGPGERDANQRANARRASSGPWTKITDAPADVQKEIKRQADKFAPKTEDGRKKFVATTLEGHYRAHQRKQAGK